jgi:hypothetical protein
MCAKRADGRGERAAPPVGSSPEPIGPAMLVLAQLARAPARSRPPAIRASSRGRAPSSATEPSPASQPAPTMPRAHPSASSCAGTARSTCNSARPRRPLGGNANEAWSINGCADHFLTDAFSGGHMGRPWMAYGDDMIDDPRNATNRGLAERHSPLALGHRDGLSGRLTGVPATFGAEALQRARNSG